jgi:hypothetical protein
MTRANRRRLSRLEKLAEPVIVERKRREAEIVGKFRDAAGDHAVRLAVVILYGEPKIDEPLALAWSRALAHLELADTDEKMLRLLLHLQILKTQPGGSEDAKLAHVLASAPQWLLTFCAAHRDAEVLGFDLPKHPEPPPIPGADARKDMQAWPLLPTGTLGAGGPICEDEPNPFHVLTSEEFMDLRRLIEKDPENWSRQDRRRYRKIMAEFSAANGLGPYRGRADNRDDTRAPEYSKNRRTA